MGRRDQHGVWYCHDCWAWWDEVQRQWLEWQQCCVAIALLSLQ